MSKRQNRLAHIVNLLLHNNVRSQDELLELLLKSNYNVTQATLSRDLKTLRTSKVATEKGEYRYIITSGVQPDDDFPVAIPDTARHSNIVSVVRTGTIVVIKTRLGYAPGVAYDIDMLESQHILGTIAGSDTLFVAINQNSSLRDVFVALSFIVPGDILNECRAQFVD